MAQALERQYEQAVLCATWITASRTLCGVGELSAQGQLARAELALLGAELTAAFNAEAEALQVTQEATAARAGAQATMQTYQTRLEALRREHAAAKRRLDEEGAP